MLKFSSILSVFCGFVFLATPVKADSFLLSENTLISKQKQEQIIPLVFIKDLEFYNRTKTAAFTQRIADKLSLEPKIIITDNEILADYYITPFLLQSKMAPLNQDTSRYSMSVKVELWSKGGILIDSATQNRYIVIENDKNTQAIAKKLLIKLLDEALTELFYKVNSTKKLSYLDNRKVAGPSLTNLTFISA